MQLHASIVVQMATRDIQIQSQWVRMKSVEYQAMRCRIASPTTRIHSNSVTPLE